MASAQVEWRKRLRESDPERYKALRARDRIICAESRKRADQKRKADPVFKAENAKKKAEKRAQNPEPFRQANREYMRSVPIEQRKTWEQARRERERGTTKAWLQAACVNANRRSKRLGRPGRLEWREVLAKFESVGQVCIDCGATGLCEKGLRTGKDALHLGHAVPLCYDGSQNVLENIIFQCRSCNTKQHNAVHLSAGKWQFVRVE